jgi:hypothetical protein
MEVIKRVNDDRIDELEAVILSMPQLNCPLVHRFTKGMYIREIFMEAGSLITSKIHNTNHPFVISKGIVNVVIDNGEWVELAAPHTGITLEGTRRVLYIVADCVWTTFHPLDFISGEENDWSDEEKEILVEKIEDIIIEKHVNKALGTNKKLEL